RPALARPTAGRSPAATTTWLAALRARQIPYPSASPRRSRRTATPRAGMAGTADLGGAPKDGASEIQGAARRPPARRRPRAPGGWAITVLVAVALAFGIRAFVFQAFSIPTSSMESTLDVGDRILVWKAFFDWHDVHQGDVVVFTHPPHDHCAGPAGTDLVKRVIALPGQTIYSVGNNIYVDGRRLPQPYLPPTTGSRPPYPQPTGKH